MKQALLCCLGILLLVSACTAQQATELTTPTVAKQEPTSMPSTMSEAHDALVDFFTLLHNKNYEDAASLYGGDYEQLKIFNTEIDPADQVALWAWACDNQLLQCLEVRSATFEQLSGDSYIFQVEFNNPDGSLFVLGPCCGGNETDMPPVSQFEYTVWRNTDGKFVVMNMPPYMP